MTLEAIYYIGQTIAVIVIIATLIALLVQTRQTNALARVETSRSNMYWFVTEQHRLFATPEDPAFMHKALFTAERLSDEEKSRFGFSMALIFGLMESAHYTHKTGLFRDVGFVRATAAIRNIYLTSPRGRKWWTLNRPQYFGNPEFIALIDRLVKEVETHIADSKATQTP